MGRGLRRRQPSRPTPPSRNLRNVHRRAPRRMDRTGTSGHIKGRWDVLDRKDLHEGHARPTGEDDQSLRTILLRALAMEAIEEAESDSAGRPAGRIRSAIGDLACHQRVIGAGSSLVQLARTAQPSYGAKRIRTADLLGAIQALSQLSYSPANAQYIERQAGSEPGRTGASAAPSCVRTRRPGRCERAAEPPGNADETQPFSVSPARAFRAAYEPNL